MKEKLEQLKAIIQQAADDNGMGEVAPLQLENALELLDALLNSDCERRGCSYYSHYLMWFDPSKGDPQLVHEAFHAAEKQCERAQKRFQEWLDANRGNQKPIPQYIEQQAAFWERKVCA